tara:strand:+ start:172 stop:471 length:300 start_codon:yes stop_codon:yes gene_type:complete
MKKKTPIFKLSSLTNPKTKTTIQKSLYKQILKEIKANISSSKSSVVVAHIHSESDKEYYDVVIERDEFETNLNTILTHHEEQENYEKCSEIQSIISQLK